VVIGSMQSYALNWCKPNNNDGDAIVLWYVSVKGHDHEFAQNAEQVAKFHGSLCKFSTYSN